VVTAVACSEPPTPPGESAVVWHVAGHAGAGRPALDDSTVYFMAAADSHVVHALSIVSGQPRWSASTGLSGTGRFSETGCLLAAPVVACGDGAALVGLSKVDGHLLWSFQPAVGRAPGVYIATLDSAGTTLYAPTPDNAVHAVDVASGQARWSTTIVPGATEQVFVYKVVDGGDMVFAPFTMSGPRNTGGLVAVAKSNGAVRWMAPFANPDSNSGAKDVALWKDYVLVSLEGGKIIAVDRTSGAIAWSLPGVKTYPSWMPGGVGPVIGDLRTLAVSGDILTAISQAGWIVSYDLTSQSEIGRGTTTSASAALWTYTGDAAAGYFTSTSGILFSFDFAKPQSERAATGPFESLLTPAALSSDRIFIGGVHGYYAFHR
jgi:outer membrane protein assembly factor BamB